MIQLFTTAIDERTKPADMDRIVRNLRDVVAELQGRPLVAANVIKNIVLADGVKTPIPHGLGRRATVFVSPQRGVTLVSIEEFREGSHDPSKFVVLRASGGTVTVDLIVVPL